MAIATKEEKEAAEQRFQRMVDGLRRVIVDTLSSDSPMRFSEAARLCEVAQQLVHARATRVDQFAGELAPVQPGGVPAPVHPIVQQARPYVVDANWGFAQHQRGYAQPLAQVPQMGRDNQQERDAQLAGSQLLLASADTLRSQASASEATELKDLFLLADQLRAANTAAHPGAPRRIRVIEARIETLMARMEGRNAVVPADDVRGRPDAEPGGRDGGHGDGPVANGAGGP